METLLLNVNVFWDALDGFLEKMETCCVFVFLVFFDSSVVLWVLVSGKKNKDERKERCAWNKGHAKATRIKKAFT